MTLPYFYGTGFTKRAVLRHGENQRHNNQATVDMKKGLLKEGVVPGVRGECVCTEPASELLPALVVAGGTITDAVVLAALEDPHNEFVKATLAQGLTRCLMIQARTPGDVIRWLKVYYNQYHNGTKYTLVELLQAFETKLAFVALALCWVCSECVLARLCLFAHSPRRTILSICCVCSRLCYMFAFSISVASYSDGLRCYIVAVLRSSAIYVCLRASCLRASRIICVLCVI